MVWFWPSWLRRRPLALAETTIVLYSRAGCHLCDDAVAILAERKQRYGFRLDVIDVDGDARLVEQFGNCVPVVTVNGKVRFRGRIEPALLDRLLVGELGGPTR